MTISKIRLLSLLTSSVTLICTLMAIQTGSYSLSEKWAWSGIAVGLFGFANAIVQAFISDVYGR